jgi:hypothetical protein
MTDTAYKNKKQNKITGVSIRTAKIKLKFYHNKTSTFGVEVGWYKFPYSKLKS